MRQHLTLFKTALIGLLLAISALIFGGPWVLYQMGLTHLEGKPTLPENMIHLAEQRQLWQQAGYAGEPELEELNPVSYLLTAGNQEAPPASTMFAWRIVSAYQRERAGHDGIFWKQVSGSALAIWVTRHWTIEQILSKVAAQQGAATQNNK
ncbi:hypothetical protein ACO0LB_01700 [Undibacterium sp. SXout7W]|uniref:hypothetical protein n=1 Tax=Undibacterium sp. SXout7W TaxID=3413049 RepID=UPI003BF35E90